VIATIPPIPIDLIVSLWLGLAFAGCARLQFRDGAPPWGRELAAVLSFAAFGLLPAEAYLCLVHADWTWMYLVEPARLGNGVLALVLSAVVAALLTGWGVGWQLVRRRKTRALALSLVGAALAAIALGLVGRARIGSYGSFAEYHAGHAQPLFEVKLGWVLLALGGGITAQAIAVGWTLWAHGRRALVAAGKPAAQSPEGTEPSQSVPSQPAAASTDGSA